jgi:hypothetical protein
MPPRVRAVLPLVAAGLVLAAIPALAAKPQPTSIGTVTAPVDGVRPGAVSGSQPVCQMGVTGPAVNAYGYILAPDDGYYTLLNPGSCPTCPQDGFRIMTAHAALYFTGACEIPVTVSVVPAVEASPGCLAPNPTAPPICPPVQYIVSDEGQLNQCVDYALAMPPGCCIDGPAFLVIEFDAGTCGAGRPAFCGPAACALCTQYNFYPGVLAPGDDLCAVLTPFALTGNIMYAEAECCSVTPVRPGSWGTIKVIYR